MECDRAGNLKKWSGPERDRAGNLKIIVTAQVPYSASEQLLTFVVMPEEQAIC